MEKYVSRLFVVVLVLTLTGCLEAAKFNYTGADTNVGIPRDTAPVLPTEVKTSFQIPDEDCHGNPFWVRIWMGTQTHLELSYGERAITMVDQEYLVDGDPVEILVESPGCGFQVELVNHSLEVSRIEFRSSETVSFTVYYGRSSETLPADGYEPRLIYQVGNEEYWFHVPRE
ncbi:MAG TPA: hypothetical protein VJH75_00440 [Patescibacteria group bacterium]|nr:hypothetical protein [Patescibacteria group bacterium]